MTLDDALRDPELIPHVRRWLLEQLAAGLLPPVRAVNVARRVGVELEAESYAAALFELPRRARRFSDPATAARQAVLAYFLKYSEYMPVQLLPDLGAVLIKGERRRMPALIDRCVHTVEQEYARSGFTGWHMAVSGCVDRLEDVAVCFEELGRLWALRGVRPGQRVIRAGSEGVPVPPENEESLRDLDPAQVDPSVLLVFLRTGERGQEADFAARYLEQLGPAVGFPPLRAHVMLSARFTAERFLEGLGLARKRLEERLPPWDGDDPEGYLTAVLSAAMALREEAAGGVRTGALGAAVEYVRLHFTDPGLTLAQTAEAAGVTASYLSALFRRGTGRTFTQYVTERRMELARQLLRTTDSRPGRIAQAAGFRDRHYFNALFKKTQGCTPLQFRAGTDPSGPAGDMRR